MSASRTNKSQPRDRSTGKFSFVGQWERVCVCGHQLAVHLAEAPHPCANEDTGIDSSATGEECECQRFRPRRQRGAAQQQTSGR